MNPCRSIAASLALICPALLASAQTAPSVPPPPRLSALPPVPLAAAAAASAASAPARAASSANLRVIEDDQVRIEEVRDARGQLQRVTVHSKVGGRSYEIIVPPGGKDSSQPRGTSGQAAWRIFDF